MERSGTLLVHPGALGDVVIALGPAGRVPRPVWVAARGAILRLAPFVPWVERWFDLEGRDGQALLGDRVDCWPAPLRASRAAFVLRRDADGELGARLSRDLGAPVVARSAIPPPGCSAHRHLARLLGVSDEPMGEPWVWTSETPLACAPVVIHPGSGGRSKRWSIAAFADVARILTRRKRVVTWLLGEAELDDRLSGVLDGDVVMAPPLDEAARLLAGASAYLGNDSGVSHLAAAVGTPSVLVFGPTAPEDWAPAAPWVAAVRGDPAMDASCWGLEPERIAALLLDAARG